jgi:hypothetical protein
MASTFFCVCPKSLQNSAIFVFARDCLVYVCGNRAGESKKLTPEKIGHVGVSKRLEQFPKSQSPKSKS